MRALIQHNFRSGLGDMYCDMSEYMTIAKQLKEMGYEIDLIFCLAGCRYSKENIFFKIFDNETINFFSSVKETFIPITEINFHKYEYHSTCHEHASPGLHRWDLFLDTPLKTNLERVRYSINNLVQGDMPEITPEFSSEIHKRVKSFEVRNQKNYSFLHLRVSDIKKDVSHYHNICQIADNFLRDKKEYFYLGTNNDYIFDYFKNRDNIIRYDFESFPKLGKDVNEIDSYHGNESFFDRMCDNIAEMILIKNSDTLYYYSEIERLSNFYIYGFFKNQKMSFVDLKESLN